MDYIQFCGVTSPVNVLPNDQRISAKAYAGSRDSAGLTRNTQYRLIDVREKVQYDLCHLPGSINIPFSRVNMLRTNAEDQASLDAITEMKKAVESDARTPLLLVCRLGNDSQIAVQKFRELGIAKDDDIWIGDLKGGLKSWREQVEPDFPDY